MSEGDLFLLLFLFLLLHFFGVIATAIFTDRVIDFGIQFNTPPSGHFLNCAFLSFPYPFVLSLNVCSFSGIIGHFHLWRKFIFLSISWNDYVHFFIVFVPTSSVYFFFCSVPSRWNSSGKTHSPHRIHAIPILNTKIYRARGMCRVAFGIYRISGIIWRKKTNRFSSKNMAVSVRSTQKKSRRSLHHFRNINSIKLKWMFSARTCLRIVEIGYWVWGRYMIGTIHCVPCTYRTCSMHGAQSNYSLGLSLFLDVLFVCERHKQKKNELVMLVWWEYNASSRFNEYYTHH